MRRLLFVLALVSLVAACAGESTSAPSSAPATQTSAPTNMPVPQPFPRFGVAGVIPPRFPNSSPADYAALYASILETGGLLGVYTNWYDTAATAGQVPNVFVATQGAAQQGKFSILMQIGVNHESPQGHVSTVDWGDLAEVERLRLTAVAIVQRFKPAYLGIGGEVNRLWESDKAAWNGFVGTWPALYDAVKAASPETRVFTVFQLETLKGKAFLDGRSATRQPGWELLKAFGERLDVAAFTTYPFFDYGSPAEVPSDYYREIMRHTSKPIAFTEIGWPSAPLSSVPNSKYGGSPEEQSAFAQRFFELTRDLNAPFSLWAFPNDITGAGVSFESLALRTTEGSSKPALAVWRTLARP